MDDFLHNLRSGKLKQHDRNRPYNDAQYKGGQRRNIHQDRRKKELEAFERLNAVKEVLEAISGTQKRMAEAYEARTMAENRKAKAMEVLAKNIYRMLNPNAKEADADALFDADPVVVPVPSHETDSEIQPEGEIECIPKNSEAETASDEDEDEEDADTNPRKLSESERKTLYDLISRMRDEGNKWEQIARHIASKDYPTLSGKGTWRGAMAKSLYEKMDMQ